MPPTTSVTNEIVDVVRIADGDFAEPRDMMAVQSQAQRRAWTELMGALGQAPWHPAIAGTTPACQTIGDALAPTFATADVKVSPGSFFFATTADPGQPTPFALLHTVTAETTVGTASANASGSDRADLLTVKVARLVTNAADNATRIGKLLSGQKVSRSTPRRYRTELTLGYYEGTPGAGDPSIDAGEVAIARYTMRAGQSAFIASDIDDLRTRFRIIESLGDVSVAIEPFDAAITIAGAPVGTFNSTTQQWAFVALNAALQWRLPAISGDTVTSVTMRVNPTGGSDEVTLAILPVTDGAIGAALPLGGTGVSSSTGSQDVTATLVTPYVLSADTFLVVTATMTGTTSAVNLYSGFVTKSP